MCLLCGSVCVCGCVYVLVGGVGGQERENGLGVLGILSWYGENYVLVSVMFPSLIVCPSLVGKAWENDLRFYQI